VTAAAAVAAAARAVAAPGVATAAAAAGQVAALGALPEPLVAARLWHGDQKQYTLSAASQHRMHMM
jgi:hypothetical protein